MSFININKIYELLDEIKRLINHKNLELLDVNQAAEYLKLQRSYIYSLIHQKKIPYYKPLGKRVYFNKRELNEWITKSKIKSVEEVEEDYNKQKETEEDEEDK